LVDQASASLSRRRSFLILALLAAVAGGGWYSMWTPGRSYRGPLPPLTAEETEVASRLKGHVERLAGEIGERNLWRHDALGKAATYIEGELRARRYTTASQAFDVQGRSVRNVEAELRGSSRPDEIVVVGAHYDSVSGCPGADDNASGVAALIELARWYEASASSAARTTLKGRATNARTIRFVGFVNEEPPFFQTADMGSLRYAARARERGERIVAMISVESVGYYADAPDSQRYPFPFNLFYPSTGDFIAFVGNVASRGLLHNAMRSFRDHARLPSEGAAAPAWIEGVGWSDHWAFWQHGYPAIMVTDTALFRYAHYHTARDTPDKLDYARMARLVTGLARVIEDLAR
jgi:Zn-dependent M28 family amino/carboxypeptidase